MVTKLRTNSKELEASVATFKERLQEVQTQHSQNLPELQKLEQQERDFSEIGLQISSLEALAQAKKDDAQRVLATIEQGSLYNEPLNELKQHLVSFHNERIPQGREKCRKRATGRGFSRTKLRACREF